MAITRVAVATPYYGGSPSVSLNVGSDADRYVVAWVHTGNSTDTCSAVTVNGVSLGTALIDTTDLSGHHYYLFAGSTSATGSQTVAATITGGSTTNFLAVSYTGVNTTRNPRKDEGVASEPSSTLTTVSGDMVVAWGQDSGTGRIAVATSPATLLLAGGTAYVWGLEQAADSTSETIAATFSNGNGTWYQAAVALVPSGATSNPHRSSMLLGIG